MLKSVRKLFQFSTPAPDPAVPAGERIYAIGDVHGRLDLLAPLVDAIEDDDHAAGRARTTVIFLGDLIDRGPDSAGVVDLARRWKDKRRVRILTGNHEEMLLSSFEKTDVLRHFLRHGGRETILSYGLDEERYSKSSLEELQQLMLTNIPRDDIAFLSGLEDHIIVGDYAFVHAGILPQVEMAKQKLRDMRWIREPFLSYEGAHSHVVVHGHTITEDVELRQNRIGIDTGAYCHGRLTALVLEGTARRFLYTEHTEDGISVRR